MMTLVCAELKKTVCNIRFPISCLMLLVLMLTAKGVLGGYDVPEYSILMMFFKTDEQLWLQEFSFSWQEVVRRGLSTNYLGVFLPLIVSFPMIPVFCDEMRSGNWRFAVTRTTKEKYIAAKCLAAAFTGCACALLPILLFTAVCACVFPSISVYEFVYFGGTEMLCQEILFLMAFVITDALFCLMAAALIPNKFSSVCFPVVLFFLCEQLAQKLYARGHDIRWFIFSPDQLYEPFQWLPALIDGCPPWAVLLIPFALSVVLIALIRFFIRKQVMN